MDAALIQRPRRRWVTMLLTLIATILIDHDNATNRHPARRRRNLFARPLVNTSKRIIIKRTGSMQNVLLAAVAAFTLSFSGAAFAAEPIVGHWQSVDGGMISVSSCGQAYCATVIKGEHKGESVGKVQGSGNLYTGTVIDPRSSKSYDGKITVEGARMTLQGCALKVLCKSSVWTKA